MKLSFSTLACPQWSWERIVEQARVLGYDGIEFSGLQEELHASDAEPLLAENRPATQVRLATLQLCIACLDTTSMFLSAADPEDLLHRTKAEIDLAQTLGTPWVHVMGGRIPADMNEEQAVSRMAQVLNTLGAHAQGKGVSVLLETQGSFADSALTQRVFAQVDSPATGVLWDLANPLLERNTAEEVWQRLGALIAHVHVKDINDNGKPCLPGRGIVPICDCVRMLHDGGYDGWLSFEWPKRWFNALDPAEAALPAYIDYMSQLF